MGMPYRGKGDSQEKGVALLENAIEILRSIVNENNDATISDYQKFLEAYKRVYASILEK